MNWMIYGANGYTGALIAKAAAARGLSPILAGRGRAKIESLAQTLNLPSRIVDLNDTQQLQQALQDCELVLHCAGPFSATAAVMMDACLATGTHYLDITGEIAVFEHAQSLHERAKAAQVVICPGVGFDVIPTDCVAAALKQALPDATALALGFDSRSGMSPGTAKTSVEGMSQGGKIRRDGQIITVPLAYEVRHIDFGDGEKPAMTIPWGDVSTAFYSTGIPNIRVFIPGSMGMIRGAKLANLFRPLLSWKWLQNLIKARIEKNVTGPDDDARATMPTCVWGEARNAQGQIKTARLVTENAYSLTVTGALAVAETLLAKPVSGGSYTPSALMGAEFVTTLPGSGSIHIT